MHRRFALHGWHRIAFVGVLAGSACLGCGSGVTLVPAGGVVQHDGKPMTGGKVLLLPIEKGNAAIGQIQENGSFLLTTFKPEDGAVPGRYRVTVVSDLQVQGKEQHVTCIAPKKFILEVAAERDNDFVVNVNPAEGWNLLLDD